MRIFSSTFLTATILALTASHGWCASTGVKSTSNSNQPMRAATGPTTPPPSTSKGHKINPKVDLRGRSGSQATGNSAMDRLQGMQGGM